MIVHSRSAMGFGNRHVAAAINSERNLSAYDDEDMPSILDSVDSDDDADEDMDEDYDDEDGDDFGYDGDTEGADFDDGADFDHYEEGE